MTTNTSKHSVESDSAGRGLLRNRRFSHAEVTSDDAEGNSHSVLSFPIFTKCDKCSGTSTQWTGQLDQQIDVGQLTSSLDEPLHLQILTSLAGNLAKTPAATTPPPNGDVEEGPIQTLLRGLPELPVNGYEADEWVS